MTMLNDLYRRARAHPTPSEVTISANHVGSLVEHIRATSSFISGLGRKPRPELVRAIHAGEVKIAGVPIRVVGAAQQEDDHGA